MALWGSLVCLLLLASVKGFVLPPIPPPLVLPSLSDTALGRDKITGSCSPNEGLGRQQRSVSRVPRQLHSLVGEDTEYSSEGGEASSRDGHNLSRDKDATDAITTMSAAAITAAEEDPLGDLDALDALLLGIKEDDSYSTAPEGSPASTVSVKNPSGVLRPAVSLTQDFRNPTAIADSDGFRELDGLLGLRDEVDTEEPTHKADDISNTRPESVGDILSQNLPSAPKAPVDATSSKESIALMNEVLNIDTNSAAAARTPSRGSSSSSPSGSTTASSTSTSNALETLLDEVSSVLPRSQGGSAPSRTTTVSGDEGRARTTGTKDVDRSVRRGRGVDNDGVRSVDGVDDAGNLNDDGVRKSGGGNGLRGTASAPELSFPDGVSSVIGLTTDPLALTGDSTGEGTVEAMDDWLDDLLYEGADSTPTTPPVSRAVESFADDDGLSHLPDSDARGPRRSPVQDNVRSGGTGDGEVWGFDEKFDGFGRAGGGASRTRGPGEGTTNDAAAERAQRSGGYTAGEGKDDMQRGFYGRKSRGQESRDVAPRGGEWRNAGSDWVEDDSDGGGWGRRSYGRRQEDPTVEAMRAAQKAVTADLKALGRRGEWEDAIRALVGAKVRGVPLNVYMYNSAISAVSKCGRHKEALSMMEQMRQDGVELDVYTYSGAITACGKGGKPTKALSLLDEMEQIGIAPDMVCYGAAISACAEAGLSNKAINVMRRMMAAGYVPDKMAFNAAIAACGVNGNWGKALDILDEMRKSGLRPNQHSYRLAMEACGNGGRWERALELMKDMEEDGLTPGLPSFQAALDTLKDAGQWEKALELLGEMDELGVVPTEACFAAAIAACAEVGQWREACDVIKTMRDLNLQPTVSTYNAVLKSCVRGKCYSRALTTMTDLRTSGKRPEQETWELLVEACIVCGRWECAVEVVRDMYAEEVWFDMEAIRERFFDCPAEDLRRQALSMIALEERSSSARKRRKQNNIRAAEKRRKASQMFKKPVMEGNHNQRRSSAD